MVRRLAVQPKNENGVKIPTRNGSVSVQKSVRQRKRVIGAT